MNLEDRVNKKFEKYREVLIEKDKKIRDMSSDRFTCQNRFYDMQQRAEEFYGDWLIIDSLDSADGPSDWDLKKDENNGRYILSQNSSINQMNTVSIVNPASQKIEYNSFIASSLILKNLSLRHMHTMYAKIVFHTKSSGLIQFNFRYKDYQNFLSLQLERKSNDEGFIKLIKLSDNVYSELANLSCDKMISVLEKCYGYHKDEKENVIEIYYQEDVVVIKYNNFAIFRQTNISSQENNYDDFDKFVISINNQNSLIISDIILRELQFEEKSQIKISNISSNREIPKISEKIEKNNSFTIQTTFENKQKSDELVEKSRQQKQNLKYNPSTNKFETQMDFPSAVHSESNDKKPIEHFKENFKEKCSKFEKEEYVCNYITHIITSNKIEINDVGVIDLVKLIKANCISMMKNHLVCEQILNKLEPVRINISDFF